MPSCCVPGCNVRKKKGVPVYMASFPRNPEKRELWMKNIGKTNWKSTKYLVVCETHFANDMWEKVRVDGKRKLKSNAVPTIFPTCFRNNTCMSKNSQTDELAEQQSGAILETCDVQQDINKEHNDDLGVDVLNVTPSTSSNCADTSTLIHSRTIDNEDFNELELLKKQLAEVNEKLDLANKRLVTSDRCRMVLKKRIKRLRQIIKRLNNQDNYKWKSAIKKLFNEDQILALTQGSRGRIWSNDTIRKALRLKFACGASGYQELLKGNMPLPSERTLQRKLANIQFQEGISNDIFKLLEDKVAQFKDVRDRDCVLDEMAIAPG